MAEHADHPDVFWVDPPMRGIIPLDAFHISKSLRKRLKRQDFTVTVNRGFAEVLDGCADRAETWINDQIHELYSELHEFGYAHSIEVWMKGELAGGLYGVSMGAAFFGESMFSYQPDGSKIALVYLVARLRAGGYRLLDTQFVTSHLRKFGAIEVPRRDYHQRLERALEREAEFLALNPDAPVHDVMQLITQTS